MKLTIVRDVPLADVPKPARPPRFGRDLRVPVLPILLALALLTALGLFLPRLLAPSTLAESVLEGRRTLAGRACVAIASDISGSMANLAGRRNTAVRALLPWLGKNLQADDQIALASFTDNAAFQLAPVAAADVPGTVAPEPVLDGNGTAATPAVQLLGDAFADKGCAATQLIIISDGRLNADIPADLRDAFVQARITRVHLLNPTRPQRPPELAAPELAAIAVVPIRRSDEDTLALIYGHLIADLTGQHLRRA